MNIDQLIADLKSDSGEGVRYDPYTDTRGNLSIGIGRNLNRKPHAITDDEAEYLCANDLKDVQGELDRYAPWWNGLSEPAQRVVCELCFNMGWRTLATFTTFLGLMQAGDYASAADDLAKTAWAKEVQATRVARITETLRNAAPQS